MIDGHDSIFLNTVNTIFYVGINYNYETTS